MKYETKALFESSVFMLVCFTALYLLFNMALPFLQPILWACAIAALSYPLYSRLLKLLKQRTFTAFITLFLVTGILLAPGTFIIREIASEAKEVIAFLETVDVRQLRDSAVSFIPEGYRPWAQTLAKDTLNRESLTELAKNVFPGITARSFVIAGNIAWSVFGAFIALATAFFMLAESAGLIKFVKTLSPFSEKETSILFSKVKESISASFLGIVLVAVVQALLAGFALWVTGIPKALLLTMLMCIVAMIPFLGTPLIWFPAVVYLALNAQYGKAIFLFLWGAFVVGLIDNFMKPIIIGNKTSLHPILVFFAVFGGIIFLGPIGIFVGPAVLSFSLAVAEFLKDKD